MYRRVRLLIITLIVASLIEHATAGGLQKLKPTPLYLYIVAIKNVPHPNIAELKNAEFLEAMGKRGGVSYKIFLDMQFLGMLRAEMDFCAAYAKDRSKLPPPVLQFWETVVQRYEAATKELLCDPRSRAQNSVVPKEVTELSLEEIEAAVAERAALIPADIPFSLRFIRGEEK